MRPTLLNSCASATTAAEAAFRIDARPGTQTARATRVIALDPGAAELVRPLPEQPWQDAHFLKCRGVDGDEVALQGADGSAAELAVELDDADFVLLIATTGAGAAAATAIGDACLLRGITTAGLVLGDGGGSSVDDSDTGRAVAALRPYARTLLVSRDQRDVSGVLTALGA
jgi:hypothetical protein